jgi:sugar fermentation stimulation protein A
MQLPSTTWGILRQRYKRFLADVELPGVGLVTAHVPNSGAMRGCSTPGSACLVSPATGVGRRLLWTLEAVVDEGILVGVNTARANRLAEEALHGGVATLPGLGPVWSLRREVSPGPGTRLDLCLDDERGRYWVEVKNVSWARHGVALFPDAVTTRGRRHLDVLAARAMAGERAAVLFIVQRGDAQALRAAAEVDAEYADALTAARARGVQALAVQLLLARNRILPWRAIPVWC